MRIRNEGKRTFYFNGGSIAPKEVVDLKEKATYEALLKCYPNELVSLDELVARVVEAPVKVIEEVKEEVKEEKEVAATKGKRSKSSK